MRTFFLLFSMLLIGCGTIQQTSKTVIDMNGNLVGYAQRVDFEKEPFIDWFSKNYDEYALDAAIIDQLKPLWKGIEIKAVIGTWCGDSRRETPVFYKLLDASDFNYKNLTMITVNRDKNLPIEEPLGLDIERVPTFIFYKNNIEINRIVEFPVETLEKDFLKILLEEGYKHAYLD